ncbi:MAG: ASCH domain-containing protein [Verrucomicrobiota bacterium]
MKPHLALSVLAPAGDQIRTGRKRLEIRKWQPDTLPLRDLLIVQNQQRLSSTGLREDSAGKVSALVDVMAVREWRKEDLAATCAAQWEPGWLAWELSNVRPLARIGAVPARLRIYEIELPDE